MLTRNGWWRISTKRAVFAVWVTRGKVTWAAPIGRWTLGKRWVRISRHYRRIGAQIAHMGDPDPPF